MPNYELERWVATELYMQALPWCKTSSWACSLVQGWWFLILIQWCSHMKIKKNWRWNLYIWFGCCNGSMWILIMTHLRNSFQTFGIDILWISYRICFAFFCLVMTRCVHDIWKSSILNHHTTSQKHSSILEKHKSSKMVKDHL